MVDNIGANLIIIIMIILRESTSKPSHKALRSKMVFYAEGVSCGLAGVRNVISELKLSKKNGKRSW